MAILPQRKIKPLEDPPPLYYIDANGVTHRYDMLIFMREVLTKINEIVEVLNEIV